MYIVFAIQLAHIQWHGLKALWNGFVDVQRQHAALYYDEKDKKYGICLSTSWFGNVEAAPAARPGLVSIIN